MTDCKPAATPITKELLKDVTADIEAGKYLDQDGIRNYQKAIGMFNWDVQTIAVDRALAVSLSVKGSLFSFLSWSYDGVVIL